MAFRHATTHSTHAHHPLTRGRRGKAPRLSTIQLTLAPRATDPPSSGSAFPSLLRPVLTPSLNRAGEATS